jgi:hypothetical protein
VLIVLEEEVGTSEMYGMSIRRPQVANDAGEAPPLPADRSLSPYLQQLADGEDSISSSHCIQF